MKNILLEEEATLKIKELIDEGWEFMLHYGDHSSWCDIDGLSWEADFTREKEGGKWDNHESGYALIPDAAVFRAYRNIKNGVKLKRGSR